MTLTWEEDHAPRDGGSAIWTKYKGEVIGVVRKWWTNYLVVACTDGKVREVPADVVNITRR